MPKETELKQRLSGLTTAGRESLLRQLASKSPKPARPLDPPGGIARARPLRVEPQPTDGDEGRTVAVYPAGPGQLQMWYHHCFAPDSPVYNSPLAFELLGPVDVSRLETALRTVVKRHDSLRTTFAMEDNRLVQRVASSSVFHLIQIDLASSPEAQRKEVAARCVEEWACRPFDLTVEPQVRVVVVRLEPERHVLLLNLHHINSDGWSRSNLCREVSTFYEGISGAAAGSLPVQFADYAAWKNEQGKRTQVEQMTYWTRKLDGAVEPLNLPSDRPHPVIPSFQGDRYWLPLDAGLWAALKARAQAEGTTLFTLLLATFKTLLHRQTHQNDVRVGVPVANRQRVETEGLIGLLINTLVLRTTLSPELTFRELLDRVKTTALEGFAHSDLPFERLVETFRDRPGAQRTPLIQTLFALQDFPETRLSLAGLQVNPFPVSTRTAKVDLSVAVERSGDGWIAKAEYSTDLFEPARVERLFLEWRAILETVASDPGQRLDQLGLPKEAPGSFARPDPGGAAAGRRCCLIGEGSLPIQCGEILLKENFQLVAVVAEKDDALSGWARKQGLAVLPLETDLAGHLGGRSFDYLFSVNNARVLPEGLLALAAVDAINYHDALLPRYAGLHAPSWAIFHGEKQHGVTWHRMVKKVDAGDILKQRVVSVARDDTALSLSQRCMEAAIESFAELVKELASGTAVASRQDLTQRTYFSQSQRPAMAGLVAWNQPAAEIEALFRALDFGPFLNPLALPKIILGRTLLVATKAEGAQLTTDAVPGTVLEVDDAALIVSTSTLPLRISGLMTLSGKPLSTRECAEAFGLQPGYPLPELDASTRAMLRELNAVAARHELFWVKRLETLQSLPLPILNQPTMARDTGDCAHHSWLVPEEVREWLRSSANSWTQGEFLLAAFGAYLARTNERDEFDIGFSNGDAGGQPELALELFAPCRPFRFTVDLSRGIDALLTRTRAEMDRITHSGWFARDLIPRHPQLRQRPELAAGYRPTLTFSLVGNAIPIRQSASPGVTFLIPEQGDEGGVLFDPARYDEASVQRLLDQYGHFLCSVAGHPEVALARADLLPEKERQTLLVEWNQIPSELSPDRCIHWLIEEQAARVPDATAIVFDRVTLTYQELNQRANQVAQLLLARQVGPDTLVGLWVERSPAMIIGLLAILKAGGAYLPLDPAYPIDRVGLILADAQPRVLLTIPRLAAKLPTHEIQVIDLHSVSVSDAGGSAHNPTTAVTPANLAYVIYTSGSTGQPNGVLIEHRSLSRYTLAAIRKFGLTTKDRVLQFASLAFDASAEEIFFALAAGATLTLRTDEMIARPATFLDCCARWKVTFLGLPTAYWAHLSSQMDADNLTLPPDIRVVIVGGERAAPETLALWQKRVAQRVRLFNTYGPTEATIVTTWCELTPERPIPGRELPIGRPVPDAAVYVLDPHLQPVPIGVSGELFISGSGLARGYLNRPQLTAQRFILNPFPSPPGARLYRTGDKVRYRPNGHLEFLGRLDYQVKVRGHRVELGEIESTLSGHPDIRAVVVIAQAQPGEETVLAAFYTARRERKLAGSALREWLSTRLPNYMVPGRFVQLDSLPITANGKVDRKALALAPELNARPGADSIPPRNELERQLTGIWEAALGRGRLGVRDDFFDLGGHSLLAIVINARIAQVLKVEVPLRWLFENPTIEGLAKRMEAKTHQPSGPPIVRADREGALPMSHGQQQMWLLQGLLPDPATYNVPFACRFWGIVDRARLRSALQAIVTRHEVLRTRLEQKGDQFVQEVAPDNLSLPWESIDFTALSGSQLQAALEARLRDEVRRPIDLTRAPLWRVLCCETGLNEFVLAFTFHHSILDEWSLRLFFQELELLYQPQGSVVVAALPELPIQYADYSAWQQQTVDTAALEVQNHYWKTQLDALPPPPPLLTEGARPDRRLGHGATHHFQIADSTMTRLRELARAEDATLFSLLLAALQVWLFQYTGQSDVVVGVPVTRRERPELQSLIGFFLNTLPIRTRCEEDLPFRQLLRQVRDTLAAALSHADLPFQSLAQMAGGSRQAGQQLLYRVMFVFSEEPSLIPRLGDVAGQRLPIDTGTSKEALTFSVRAADDRWECRFEYSTELYSQSTAERMARHLVEVLQSLASQPDLLVRQIHLLSAEESRAVLVDWNQTDRAYAEAPGLTEMVEQQAKRGPNAIAVTFADRVLTYGELNARANHLAHRLRALGVRANTPVGIALERSLELIIAELATLKAGGACVPLDVTLPPQRLKFLINDAACPIVLARPSVQRELEAHLSHASLTWFDVESGTADLPTGNCANPAPVHTISDLAYILYTSGSTGQPKGVEMPHRGLLNLVHWQASTSSMREGSRTLQFANVGFDVSFQEIFGTLTSGGILVLVDDESRRNPAALLADLNRGKVERMFLPVILLEHVSQAGLDQKIFPAQLREVIVAGEQLRISPAIRQFFKALPDCQLWNHYGPTESHVVTAHRLTGPPSSWPDLPPIGRPIANSQVYVLDQHQMPRPVGLPGELFVGGRCLSRGYRGRPDLTEQSYVQNPFLPGPGQRLYRTGDLCRWREDGELEYLGRSDNQVKIRGHRVELGEIESALSQLDGVREAVVRVQENDRGEKYLTAYLVANSEAAHDMAGVKAALRQRLPDYMIPASFQLLPALPLTPNGKIDRRALPELAATSAAPIAEVVLPRNRLELELAHLWQRLFNRSNIGCRDNFFELGGHSLLAARVMNEIEVLLGRKLPIAALFQSPTIELLAARLSVSDWSPQWSSLVPLQPSGAKPPLFIPHGWGGDVFCFVGLAQLLAPDQPAYGLQAIGLDGKAPRHTSVEEMAAHYLREMRELQPVGPYYLAGYSMGGLIAYEIAQQLWQCGQRVALLALLDTFPKAAPWMIYLRTLAPYLRQRWTVHWRRWCSTPNRTKWHYLASRWDNLVWWIARNRRPQAVITAPPEKSPDQPSIPGFKDYYWAVASTYRLRTYPGSIDLFLSDSAHPALYPLWGNLAAGGLVVHRTPGSHSKIVTSPEHMPTLVRQLRMALRRAQERPDSAPALPQAPV